MQERNNTIDKGQQNSSHREKEDAPQEVEDIEGDIPSLRMPCSANEVVHARLAQQCESLGGHEHHHEVVQPVRLLALPEEGESPQRCRHREQHKHDLQPIMHPASVRAQCICSLWT